MNQHNRRQILNVGRRRRVPVFVKIRFWLEEAFPKRLRQVARDGRAEYVKPIKQMHHRAHEQLHQLQPQHPEPYHPPPPGTNKKNERK